MNRSGPLTVHLNPNWFTLFLPVGTMLCIGCQAGRPGCTAPTAESKHVIILSGILGYDAHVQRLVRALNDQAGGTISSDVWGWTSSNVWGNLTDEARNRAEADKLAAHINALVEKNPESKIYIVGMSGGARIVYFVCDDEGVALKPGFSFEKIVLLSGAVTASESCAAVVARARSGVYNYCSCFDEALPLAIVAGITLPIGLYGYSPVPPSVYQLSWRSSMCMQGNFGRHLQITKEPMCTRCLVPLFIQDAVGWPEACENPGAPGSHPIATASSQSLAARTAR